MDAYEATKIVFSRIQGIDPENAAKIMGLLLIQDHGEKEMIRLAFGPETLLQSVVLNARKDLGFLPPSSTSAALPASPAPPVPTANPFVITGQNSASRLPLRPPPLVVSSPSSWAPSSPFSRSGDDIHSGGDELIDEIHLHDQLSFLNDPVASGGDDVYSYGMAWGSPLSSGGNQRRSCSISDVCFGSDPTVLGWKPCLYFARGYCKNGSSCRFLHGLADEAKMDVAVEQELLLRSKSQRLLASAANAFPYSPTGSSLPPSPSGAGKCMSFFLQQQQPQSESQRAAVAAAAAAALMLGGDEPHKFMGRPRMERSDFSGMMNPSSRQIYLTFPADSTFREEDVSNYFSIYGPVQDVRIPYQQKRMFGFVTFVYPETVRLILAKGNPHFVCDARVLVKPYKEKGKVPDKYRKQVDRGDFSGCNTPTSLDSRDPFDLQQLGARILYAGSNQDVMLRRKLEEQQELQQAIELQQRRFMGLQLLDLKRNKTIPTSSVSVSPPSSFSLTNVLTTTSEGDKSLRPGYGTATAVSRADKEEMETKTSPKEDGDFQESAEHNLPDSPFASPTKSAFLAEDSSVVSEAEPSTAASASSALLASTLLPATSTLESMATIKSCFFQMPRFSSGPGAVGL